MNCLCWISCVVLLCNAAVVVKAADRCASSEFTCQSSANPCSPSLCAAGKHRYPSRTQRQYVQCSAGGECTIERCVLGEAYDDEGQQCVDRTDNARNWGISVPEDEGFISDDRCHNDHGSVLDASGEPLKFNCRSHNPCLEGRCNPSVVYYPGRSSHTYVHCGVDDGLCSEERCPQYHVFDASSQDCVIPADRCDGLEYFNCKQNNPCIVPRCFPSDQTRFPFNEENRKYVQCVDTNVDLCEIVTCDAGQVYSDADKDCVESGP